MAAGTTEVTTTVDHLLNVTDFNQSIVIIDIGNLRILMLYIVHSAKFQWNSLILTRLDLRSDFSDIV